MEIISEGALVPSFVVIALEELRAKEIVKDILENQPGFFLVDLRLKGVVGNRKLLIFIDGDEGIPIETCGAISRMVSQRLEEENFIEGKYILEVSSPGLDHPLTVDRQYKKNIGRALSIKLTDGQALEGKLLKVGKEGISIEYANQNREIGWIEIKETKVKISFK